MKKRIMIASVGNFVLAACVIAVMVAGAAGAQKVEFSLGASEWVTVGEYTLQYRGLTEQYPTYDLYSGGVLLAHFPSDPLPDNGDVYEYANVFIITTDVTPDGMRATGTITVS